jgi:Domain of unknown function (DUF4349)
MRRHSIALAAMGWITGFAWCQNTNQQGGQVTPIHPAPRPTLPLAEALQPSVPAGAKEKGLSITFSCVLQVEEIDKTLASLIGKADSLGGWFTNRSKSSLILKVPTEFADSLMAFIATSGIPMDRNLQTIQLEPQRNELLSRLKARRATLDDYFAMLKESSDSTVFTIESEIVRLQTEIDQTSGQIQKLEDQMAFAQMTVYFRFQERTAPIATGQSRFKWLNRLELPTLMGGFDYESR